MKKAFCALGMVVTLLLALLCVALLAVFATQAYALSNHRDWLTTEGKVTSLALVKQPRGYEAEIESIYLVDGEKHADSRDAWMRGDARLSLEAAKRDIVQKLGLRRVKWRDMGNDTHRAVLDVNNAHVMISYHPTFPSHGFYDGIYKPEMDHQISLNNTVGMLFAALLFIFAGGFYFCLRTMQRMKPKTSDENLFADETPR